MTNSEDSNPNLIHRIFIVNVLAILIYSFGSQIFTEIEGSWFSSYLKFHIPGGSAFYVGIMVALNAVIGTLFFIIWGCISDNLRTKYGRRRPLMLIGFLGTAFCVFLLILSRTLFLVILLGGVIIPIISNMIHMNGKIIVPDLVPPEKRGRTNMFVSILAMVASMLVWIPTIMFLPSQSGEGEDIYPIEAHHLYMIIAMITLILVGLIVFFLIKEPKVDLPKKSWLQEFKRVFKLEKNEQNSNFLKVFIASLFVIMSQNAYLPYLLILIQEIDFEVMDMLLMIPIVGGAVGLVLVISTKKIDKIGRKKIIIPSLIIAPIGGIVITFLGTNMWGIVIGFAIMMPFSTVISMATDTMTQDVLPAEARGRYMGIIRLGTAIGKAVGALISGFLMTEFGELWMFFAAGLVLWFAVPLFMRAPETLFLKQSISKKEEE